MSGYVYPERVGQNWLFADGTVLPVVAGGSTGQGDDGDAVVDPPTPPAAPPASDVQVTMTQKQLDDQSASIRKAAEREAKKAAERELAAALGVPIEEAKQIIADRKAAAEAAQSEQEKAVKAAKEREDKATERERAALAKERAADVKLALMDAGINPARMARATTLLVADIAEDADAEAIKTAAEALKTEMPEFFGATAGNGAPSGDPSGGPKPNGASQPTGMDAGIQRAQREIKTKADAFKSPFEGYTVIGGAPGGN